MIFLKKEIGDIKSDVSVTKRHKDKTSVNEGDTTVALSKMATRLVTQTVTVIVISIIIIIEMTSFNAQKLNQSTFRKNAFFKGQIPINYNLNNHMKFTSDNVSGLKVYRHHHFGPRIILVL